VLSAAESALAGAASGLADSACGPGKTAELPARPLAHLPVDNLPSICVKVTSA
jgi:hypothetical protein